MFEKKCKVCGTEFFNKNSSVEYCSIECGAIARHKVKHPTKRELEKMMKQEPMSAIAAKFSVSGNTIAKWARSYGLDYLMRPRGGGGHDRDR